MRDLEALLESIVNIDRDSLIAILSSEAEDAERLASSIRPRSASQRRRQSEAVERAARITRILYFVRQGEMAPDMSDNDIRICRSLEQMLRDQAKP
jgi:hypothetical protein